MTSKVRTLAHLSDLHLGESRAREAVCRRLVAGLLAEDVDHVVLTGDVTHGGLLSEFRVYEEIFSPLLRQRRLSVVPGNHDRMGDDVGARLMGPARVAVEQPDGLYIVRLDSTGAHNRSYLTSYGELSPHTVDVVEAAFLLAPPDALRVLLLHHHPVRLPEDTWQEWMISKLGSSHSVELDSGAELLRRIHGLCDLVLHGHRHVPADHLLDARAARPMMITNAGSSTESGHARVFLHDGTKLQGAPLWVGESASLRFLPRPPFGMGRSRRGAVRTA